MLPAALLILAAALVEAKEAFVSLPGIDFPAPSSVAPPKYSLSTDSGTFSTSLAGKPVVISSPTSSASRNHTNQSRSKIPFKPNPDEPEDNPKLTMYSWSSDEASETDSSSSAKASTTRRPSAAPTKASSTRASSAESSFTEVSSEEASATEESSTEASSTAPSSSSIRASSTTSSSERPSSTGTRPLASWASTTKLTTIPNLMTAFKGKWGWPKGFDDTYIVTPPDSEWSRAGKAPGSWSAENDGNALRTVYPKGSLTPSNKPLGGMNFYAEPIDLANAYNVSFEYSVFFPDDFDFALGGKLPGLYGGRTACSGGAAAEDCFSARMMWRTGGLGELYLYAPRSEQTNSLCTTKPLTYCGTADGMSIGRGAFSFVRGGWTHIRQDFWMNTPGVPDGGFNIWVNGELVISNDETYFRNTKAETVKGGKVKAIPRQLLFDSIPSTGFTGDLPSLDGLDSPFAAASTCAPTIPTQSIYENGAIKLVRPTVSGYKVIYKTKTATRQHTSTKLHIATSTATIHAPSTVQKVVYTTQTVYPAGTSPRQTAVRMARRALPRTTITERAFTTETEVLETTQTARTTVTSDSLVTRTSTSTILTTVTPSSAAAPSSSPVTPPQPSGPLGSDDERNPDRPWTFMGVQHMTFFGGSSDKWRSPKTQYSYFNSWKMTINS